MIDNSIGLDWNRNRTEFKWKKIRQSVSHFISSHFDKIFTIDS